MKSIEAVVFDADGTLLATRELIHHGYHTTLTDHGYHTEAAELDITRFSKPVRDTYAHILAEGGHDQELVDALTLHHEDVQNANTHLIGIYKGVKELLDVLQSQKVKRAIFTSGTMWHLERNFSVAGIEVHDEFEAFVTAEDNIPRKPAPDGIELALERLGGIAATRAIMIGDHAADIQAGLSAGVVPIGITHGFGTAEELKEAGAEHVVASIPELQKLLMENYLAI